MAAIAFAPPQNMPALQAIDINKVELSLFSLFVVHTSP